MSTPDSTQNAMAYGRTPCLFSCRTGEIKRHLKETDCQLKIWEALFKIPLVGMTAYGDIASLRIKVRLCRFEVNNLTFYNLGQRLFNILRNIRLFCVSCDDDDNRSNDLHDHNLRNFCILHSCDNLCIPSSPYRIYTCGRYSPRNNILFSLFPFLFCPFVQTGSHSRLKNEDTSQYDFFINYNVLM